MLKEHWTGKPQCLCARLAHRGERAIELAGIVRLEQLKLHAEGRGRLFHAAQHHRLRGTVARIVEDSDPANPRIDFPEKLELLAEDVRTETVRDAGDVSARPRKARHELDCNGLGQTEPDDRN